MAAKLDSEKHPLLKRRLTRNKIAIIVIASNRGLAGGFNREIIEMVGRHIADVKAENQKANVDIYLLGKRGRDIVAKYGATIVAEYEKQDVTTSATEVTSLARTVIEDYMKGVYDQVFVAYTDFRSAMKQIPRLKKLLPIEKQDEDLGTLTATNASKVDTLDYLFEPSPEDVLDVMLARLIELQMFQALLESNASEHSARMLAMRNASDAANDMIEDLVFAYNQARQEAITTELADISGGRSALEGK